MDTLSSAIKHELRERIASESAYMASGKCIDFTDYKRHCGIVTGLEMAINLVNEAAKRIHNDEDEEDF